MEEGERERAKKKRTRKRDDRTGTVYVNNVILFFTAKEAFFYIVYRYVVLMSHASRSGKGVVYKAKVMKEQKVRKRGRAKGR